MTYYKPYTDAWNRRRYLKEAIDKYLDDGIDNEMIVNDICGILYERSEKAYQEFTKINDLEGRIRT